MPLEFMLAIYQLCHYFLFIDLSMEAMGYIEKLNAIDATNPLSIISSAYNKTQNREWIDATTVLKGIESIIYL